MMNIATAQNILRWFMDFKEEKIKGLPIKTQWDILSNVKLMHPDVLSFEECRDELIQDIRAKFYNEEASDEVQEVDENGEPKFDENGDPIMTRKVKPEYMDEYKDKVADINDSINQVLSEERDYKFKKIDIDAILDKLPEDTDLELVDIEMISLIG